MFGGKSIRKPKVSSRDIFSWDGGYEGRDFGIEKDYLEINLD